MKNRFSSLISTYDDFINSADRTLFLNSPQEFLGFWQRWTLMHKNILKELDLDEEILALNKSNYSVIIRRFMQKREALLSALLQGAKKDTYLDLAQIKDIMHQHDNFFLQLLNQILEEFNFELTKIQTARRVSSAYSYQHLQGV